MGFRICASRAVPDTKSRELESFIVDDDDQALANQCSGELVGMGWHIHGVVPWSRAEAEEEEEDEREEIVPNRGKRGRR